jgi:3-oxoacyl-(acyl-carrier-protein) synthase
MPAADVTTEQPTIHLAGTGLISCLGRGVPEVFDAMLAGHCGIRPLTRFPADAFAQQHGGQLAEADEEALLDAWPDDDIAVAMIKAAATDALAAAKSGPGDQPDAELGLVLATNFGVMGMLEWCWRERLETGGLDADTYAQHHHVLDSIAAYLGADGPRAQLSLSCASGAAAVAVGRRWLLAGRARRVLVIGYDALTEFCWTGLSNLRTITSDRLRPFDESRKGTIFSEGAAAALLVAGKTVDDDTTAVAVLGAATNNNAFHLTAPAREGAGSQRVMAAALTAAGLAGDAVDWVSAHATGTEANDRTECAAIRAIAGDQELPVAAFKSALGHMLGAAGLAEVVIAATAVTDGRIPPVVNLQTQAEACPVDAVVGSPRTGDWQTVLTNSAGIGGNNAAVVLGRAGATRPAPAPATVGIAGAGWVLPDQVGNGATPPPTELAPMLDRGHALDDFSVKPYIESVKGYLDPAGAYTLAAAALAFEAAGIDREDAVVGVVAATAYGAPTSGYRFFEQTITKGPRLASPLIFPHSYPNTAANLVAIEFGLAGPHLVFCHPGAAAEAVWHAHDLVAAGECEAVVLIASEAVPAAAVPDDTAVLNGAIALVLTSNGTVPMPAPGGTGSHGAVHDLLSRFA